MVTIATSETFHWRAGSRVPGKVPAESAAVIFRDLAERDGAVTPRAVVDVATPEESPLHPAIEWNDESAAENYRLIQAGNLIRSLIVVRQRPNAEASPPMRAYVRIRAAVPVSDEDDELDPIVTARGHYIPIVQAMEDAPLRERLLERARHELQAWRQRHKELVEFAAVFEAIDAAD